MAILDKVDFHKRYKSVSLFSYGDVFLSINQKNKPFSEGLVNIDIFYSKKMETKARSKVTQNLQIKYDLKKDSTLSKSENYQNMFFQ